MSASAFTGLRRRNLPNWISNTISDLHVYESAANGDCFFSSIQTILSTLGIHRSIDQLRHIVARTVLDDKDEIINKTIRSWLQLYQEARKERDFVLAEEYKHMRGLENATYPLNEEQRKLLYNNMMTPLFWGESNSARIIEEATQMRLLIFNGDFKKPSLNWFHSTKFKPTHYCFLWLSGHHYMPVSWKNQFIYDWKDLSYEIQYFFTQAYTKPKE